MFFGKRLAGSTSAAAENASSKVAAKMGKLSVTAGQRSSFQDGELSDDPALFERVLPLLLKKFLETEVLLYFVSAVKHNKKGKMQYRLFVVTDQAVYNLTDKGKFVKENRVIPAALISGLTIASEMDPTGELEGRIARARAEGNALAASKLLEEWVAACKKQQAIGMGADATKPAQFVLHVPNSYDYRFSLPRRGYSYVDGEWVVADEPALEGVIGVLQRVCGRGPQGFAVRTVDTADGDLRHFVTGDKSAGRSGRSAEEDDEDDDEPED